MFFLPLLAMFCVNSRIAQGLNDLAISDFTDHTYGNWKVTGQAFRSGPAGENLLSGLRIENAADNAVICSDIEGDRPTGRLVSAPFKIQRKYIAFRIGGG